MHPFHIYILKSKGEKASVFLESLKNISKRIRLAVLKSGKQIAGAISSPEFHAVSGSHTDVVFQIIVRAHNQRCDAR